nr:TetR/AcrR family transcriptional regulator [uncultured Albidiferax sp.]
MKITPPKALKPRKTPIQARSTATVDAIFQATIQVLLAEGAHRLTTTRVAERAGVSVGTMYQYFPHKQALLYAVVHQHLTEFVASFEAACVQHRNTPTAAMTEGLVHAFLETKVRDPDATRALYKIAGELDTDELRLGTAKSLQEACTTLLASATDARYDHLPDIAFTLLTAMNGTTRAVFEFGAEPRRVQMLRVQLLALCRGFLQISARQHPHRQTSV